ncbi:MAG: ABC transporter permease [Actinomycetota bacterium]|nr:ABC transporter permease [Actinomycetota bacterium]
MSFAGRVVERSRSFLPAALAFLLGLAAWELTVAVFRIERFLLPKPSVIARTFVAESGVIWPAGWFTFKEALGGFVIGSALAVVGALATARWRPLRDGLLPFAVAANSTPIIALAPITNQWFGITNPLAKMTVVAVIVFFPVMMNMVRGLVQVEPAALELMRSYGAGDLSVLRRVRLPNSLPYLFSALKVASALAVIGAIVAEYFGGSRQALGVYISQQAALFHFAEAWAAIIVGSVMGIGFYSVIMLAERLVMPWHPSLRAGS